ncbi:hypothetical protein WCWAEYFT_CDS0296 [Vibrio phage VB_VaC_TDDLMA]
MNVVAYNIIRKMVQEPESVEWKIDRNTCYAHYIVHFKNNHLITISYDISKKSFSSFRSSKYPYLCHSDCLRIMNALEHSDAMKIRNL